MIGAGKESGNLDSYQTYEALVRHLTIRGRVAEVSLQFSQLETNADRVQFAYDLLEEYEFLPALIEDRKCNETARRLREEGNAHFKFKRHQKAFECYVKSLAFAENDSENLALAYANRSAVLFEQELYGECLEDIHRALNGKYPDHLKSKLDARREKCLASKSEARKSQFHHPIPEIKAEQRNRSIQCATNAIEIASDEQNGRHVVAARDIRIAEVLAIEKAFCCLILGKFANHCHECLQLCYNLIPCPGCTEAMYCGEVCKTKAYTYHQYECKILKTAKLLDDNKLDLLPLKLVLSVRDSFDEIAKIGDNSCDSVYRSDRYEEIHRLEGNTSQRSPSDLFKRATVAASLFHVVKTYTDTLPTQRDQLIFRELLLKHMQTAPNNFHQITEMAQNEAGVFGFTELAAGAYSFASMFNHSCCPNIIRDSYGSTVIIRALRSIRKGEQCYDNYGCHYALMPRRDRQQDLKRQYLFNCRCRPCEEDWPLYQDLVVKDPAIHLDISLDKLAQGGIQYAKEILPTAIEHLEKLEALEPDKSIADTEEIIKQCLSLLANTRRLF